VHNYCYYLFNIVLKLLFARLASKLAACLASFPAAGRRGIAVGVSAMAS
jgi:hypothetical protein